MMPVRPKAHEDIEWAPNPDMEECPRCHGECGRWIKVPGVHIIGSQDRESWKACATCHGAGEVER